MTTETKFNTRSSVTNVFCFTEFLRILVPGITLSPSSECNVSLQRTTGNCHLITSWRMVLWTEKYDLLWGIGIPTLLTAREITKRMIGVVRRHKHITPTRKIHDFLQQIHTFVTDLKEKPVELTRIWPIFVCRLFWWLRLRHFPTKIWVENLLSRGQLCDVCQLALANEPTRNCAPHGWLSGERSAACAVKFCSGSLSCWCCWCMMQLNTLTCVVPGVLNLWDACCWVKVSHARANFAYDNAFSHRIPPPPGPPPPKYCVIPFSRGGGGGGCCYTH